MTLDFDIGRRFVMRGNKASRLQSSGDHALRRIHGQRDRDRSCQQHHGCRGSDATVEV